ncbi:MAG: transposase [bacterium]|nr:transposase [bacterium]
MSKTNKYVSADVKKQIIERLRNDGIPVSQLAEEHGISGRTIYGWLSKGATALPTWLELNKLKRENQALKELLGKITYEMSMAQKKS